MEKAVDQIRFADVLAKELTNTHVKRQLAPADAPFEKIVCALDLAARKLRQIYVCVAAFGFQFVLLRDQTALEANTMKVCPRIRIKNGGMRFDRTGVLIEQDSLHVVFRRFPWNADHVEQAEAHSMFSCECDGFPEFVIRIITVKNFLPDALTPRFETDVQMPNICFRHGLKERVIA